MATQETIKQLFSGGVLRDIEDADARQAITALQNALNALTSGDTTTAIENFQEVIDFLDGVTDDETLIGKITALQTAINGKQPMLTFDNAPTAGSNNPVKSGGVKTALDAKADSSNVYPKSQTYTKTEVDNAIDDALDGFTPADVPTKVSDLTNDAGYQTQQQVASAINQAAIEAVVGSGDFAMTYDAVNHIYNLIRLVPTLAVTSLAAMSENTKSGTFKVSGTNLKGNVTIATTATNWALSVNGGTASQSITLQPTDGVLAETTITVAYSGSTDSTGNTITVSSTGAESKTVTASYTEHAGPTITTSNNPISISEVGGYTNTATLQVTGTLLTGNITAALSSGSKFSLSKNTFDSPAAGDSGTQTDTLTLSSDGATSVTIQLTGTVLTQSLTLTPSSLTLESEAGTAVSGTIKVEGSNVKGDVTVGVPNGFTATLNDSSVSTLTASQVNAANGVTLTIGNAGTTASGNLTFSVGGTQLASAPLVWREAEVEEVGKTVTRAIAGTNYDLVYKISKMNGVDGATTNEVTLVDQAGKEANSGTAGNYNYPGATLDIPSSITINGHQYDVTRVGKNSLANTTAKRVIIPDSVKTVATDFFLFPNSLIEYFKVGNGVIVNGWGGYSTGMGNFLPNAATNYLTEIDLGTGISYSDRQFCTQASATAVPNLTKLTIRYSGGLFTLTENFKKVLNPMLEKDGAKIYVPSSLVSTYQSDTNWSAYASIIEAIPND